MLSAGHPSPLASFCLVIWHTLLAIGRRLILSIGVFALAFLWLLILDSKTDERRNTFMQKTNLLLLSLLVAITSACGGGGGSSSSDDDTGTTDPVVDEGNTDGNDTPEEPEQPGVNLATYESAKQLCSGAELIEGNAIIDGNEVNLYRVQPTAEHHGVHLYDYQGTVCVDGNIANLFMENFTGNVFVNGDVPWLASDKSNANVQVYGTVGWANIAEESTIHLVYDELSSMDVFPDSEGSTFTKRSN